MVGGVNPMNPADEDAVIAHCRLRLARYKVPDEIRFVDGFERTPMGKILKRALRDD